MRQKLRNQVYSLGDLRTELKWLRACRILWLIGASLYFAALAIGASNGRLFQANPEKVASRALETVALLSGAVIITLGTAKLIRTVRNIEASPTPVCISMFIVSLGYLGTHREAWNRLAAVVPFLSREQAESVDRSLWRRFYKYSVSAPPEQKHIAFDLAVLLGDEQAVPHLRRTLQSKGVSAEMREQFERSLEVLSGLPSGRSNGEQPPCGG